ncbi:MAG: hypothetical protein ABH812_02945 [bacterium]
MKRSYLKILILSLILFLGLSLRLNNINWDSGAHLQPDERFLTMVGNKIQIPKTLQNYFDPQKSTLNPANNGFDFFVYGLFPVSMNKTLVNILNKDNYFDFTIYGRGLSAIFDFLVIIFVYKTLLLIEKKYRFNKSIKYWGAFFYSILVLPIQLSHFFAVDTFLNFFIFSSFYFALKYYLFDNNKNIVYSSILFAFALASKITAFYMLPLNLYFILKKKNKTKSLFNLIIGYFLLSYVVLRFADPYLFQSSNLLNPIPNTLFSNNLMTLKSYEGPNVWFPPAIQWIDKTPILYSLYNLSFFGAGIFIFLLFLLGAFAIFRLKKSTSLIFTLFWIAAVFIYQSTQYVQNIRYFLILYPFIAIFAGVGAFYIFKSINKNRYKNIFITFFIFFSLIWPLSFSQIYNKEQTRIQASRWIYKNLKVNSVVLTEHWDDALPLEVGDRIKQYERYELPVFDRDTKLKWQKMNKFLLKGDYLILSSNRGWGSISKAHGKYPIMSGFYEELLADKLNYKKEKEFTSYPTFYASGLNITFNDSGADESFTVYDHPKVLIFKKEKN